MPDESTRPSLLSRVRDPADEAAWNELDGRYRELILRYCWARGLQPADAEDVRQVVMMGLAGALRSFVYDPSVGRFRSYLYRAVQNAIGRQRRTEARQPDADEDLDRFEGDGRHEEDEVWVREWMHHHYRRALEHVRGELEARSVRAFERLLDGASAAEVAAEVGASVDAVYKTKERVRDRLRRRIERQLTEEEFPERLAAEGPPSLDDADG